jgi:hypothetical protein
MADDIVQYSGPPFLSNIRPPIQNELNNRAKRRIRPIAPFIKATPGFNFFKGDKNKPIFKGIADQIPGKEPWQFQMRDLYKSQNAFRPVAGITAFTVDYKNVTGAVRKAAMSWTVHSLADLERLAPYFLAPGRTLFIEWGWNEYRDEFGVTHGGSQFVDTTDKYTDYTLKTYYQKTQKNVLNSSGNYEGMIGIIVNYDMTMTPDGGFNCVTHVTSTGDLMGNISMTQQNFVDPNLKPSEATGGETPPQSDKKTKLPLTLRQYIDEWIDADLKVLMDGKQQHNVTLVRDFPKEDEVVVGFTNKENGNRSGIFLSWGYIEDYILSKYLQYANQDGQLVLYDSSLSRIRTHNWLRSTDLDFCIIPYPSNDSSNYFPPFELVDSVEGKRYANPRRIMINLDFFKSTFLDAKTVEDGIAKMFGKINDACANLWRFSIRTRDELNDNDKAHVIKEIVDLNFTDGQILNSPTLKAPFVFAIKSFNLRDQGETVRVTSIVRNISLTTKLSSDAALNVFYTANSNNQVVPGNENVLRSVWDYKLPGKKAVDDFVNTELTTDTPATQDDIRTKKAVIEARAEYEKEKADQKKDETVEEGDQAGWPEEMKKYLPLAKYGWSYTFNGTTADTLDKGRELMKTAAFDKGTANNSKPAVYEAVAPMHCEVELEGISGIRAGDIFTIDNLPQLYKEKGVFQVVNITHEVTRETWKTKLKASYRVQRTDLASNSSTP